MASEKNLEPTLVREVERMDGKCFKLIAQGRSGFPDRTIFMPNGRIYFAEIKTTGKTLDPLQRIMKKILEKLGFIVFVIDSDEALQKCLNEIRRGC